MSTKILCIEQLLSTSVCDYGFPHDCLWGRGEIPISFRTIFAGIVTHDNELLIVYLIQTKIWKSNRQYDCFVYIDSGLLMKDYCLLQVAGNFHFAPAKSLQQSHVHGKVFFFSCLLWPLASKCFRPFPLNIFALLSVVTAALLQGGGHWWEMFWTIRNE